MPPLPAAISPCLSSQPPGNRFTFTLLILFKGRRASPLCWHRPLPPPIVPPSLGLAQAPLPASPPQPNLTLGREASSPPHPVPPEGPHPTALLGPGALFCMATCSHRPAETGAIHDRGGQTQHQQEGQHGLQMGTPVPSALHRLDFLYPLGFCSPASRGGTLSTAGDGGPRY